MKNYASVLMMNFHMPCVNIIVLVIVARSKQLIVPKR